MTTTAALERALQRAADLQLITAPNPLYMADVIIVDDDQRWETSAAAVAAAVRVLHGYPLMSLYTISILETDEDDLAARESTFVVPDYWMTDVTFLRLMASTYTRARFWAESMLYWLLARHLL